MSEDILTLAPPTADLRVAYGSDPNQFIDLRFPSRKQRAGYPLAMNIHGGFWRARYSLDHAGHMCAALKESGVATANVEYRRVGNPGGTWPGPFADVRSAYRFLVQSAGKHNFDVNNIAIMGHSAGGQLALCLAAHEPSILNVVSLAGVVDLQRAYRLGLSNNAVVEFLGGTAKEVPDHYREADPMELTIRQGRQRLIHGSADDIVPVAFSRAYVEHARDKHRAEKVRLIEIKGAGHFDLIDPRTAAWEEVRSCILQLLA
jgi:acetyl esterase/lipase